MKIERIALFSPASTFYTRVLLGLARGFRAIGVEANVWAGHPSPEEMRAFCSSYDPSAVLEINRSRSSLPDFPLGVPHIAWFQDYYKGLSDGISSSEITYYLLDPNAMGFTVNEHRFHDILLPGVDETIYSPGPAEPLSDFSFAGFIPSPLDRDLLETRMIQIDETGAAITYGEVFARVVEYLQEPDYLHADVGEVQEIVYEFAASRLGIERSQVPEIPPKVMNWFDVRLIRLVDRARLLRGVLSVSRSLRIFGPPDWTAWPEFEPFYERYVEDAGEVRDIYRTTRLNLHNNCNGFGMHFRVLDCMASGGCILVNKGKLDEIAGGIKQHFEPGVHYIEYTYDEVPEIAREALADEPRRRAIGEAAAAAVREKHTWTHRARQILADLERR